MLENLLILLMSLTPHVKDAETTAERRARMTVIVDAVSDAADRHMCIGSYKTNSCIPDWTGTKKHLVLLAIVQARSESALARHIHEGKCGPEECDPFVRKDGTIGHRAQSLWQLQYNRSLKNDWHNLSGVQNTKTAAFYGMKVLINGYKRCNSNTGAFVASAGLHGCRWSGAKRRQKLFDAWEPKL